MPDEGSLADRLRGGEVREAKDTDEEAVARALDEKARLSDRLEGMLPKDVEGERLDAVHPSLTWRMQGEPGPERPSAPPAPPAERGKPAVPSPARQGPADEVLRGRGAKRDGSAYAPSTPHPGHAVEGTGAVRMGQALAHHDDTPETVRAPGAKRHWIAWILGREPAGEDAGPITVVPPVPPGWTVLEQYEIEAPYSYVRILQEEATGEVLYEAIEPRLSAQERDVLRFVEDAMVRGLNVDPSSLRPHEREDYLTRALEQIIRDYRIVVDENGRLRIAYYLRRDFLGLGPIHVLMVDPGIEDISCDGPKVPIFVYHRRHESIPTSVVFPNDARVDGFVIRMAQRSGKAISISDPILDAALPDGSRLQATLGHEVTQNGSTFTIRRFKPDPFTPIDLIRFGTMSTEMLAWFWINVQHGHSLIFSGGTASGKTTGLNAIAQFIPHQAKIVSIEDTREVNLPHDNWIKSVTRTGSTSEGTGEIGMFELLKASLRQRPEYILVGEVRGIEATVAFQAMATGHSVYSTMHADSARSVVYRLENDPINIPRLVLQALDIIAIQAQTRVEGKRVRRVQEVVELVGMDPATRELLTNTVFRWRPENDSFEHSGRSYLLEQIAQSRNWSKAEMNQEFERRKRFLEALRTSDGPVDVERLTDLVKAFYRDPEGVLEQLEGS